jgi:hypothetical protein
MKKTYILKTAIFCLGLALFSCERQDVQAPQFDVQVDSTTYKVGQEITFKFSGNAQNIIFWSGEKGKNYAYRNRTSEKGIVQTFTFVSQAGAGTQNDNLSVLVSTDFSGTYDSTSVYKATWKDITTRAILSPTTTSAAGASKWSGLVNILDVDTLNKPVYFAFKYKSAANGLIPRQWTITTDTITNTLADGTINKVVQGFQSTWFTGINMNDSTYQWRVSPARTSMKFGNFAQTLAPPAGAPANEDWAISAPIKLNTVLLVDYGTPVTSISTLSPSSIYKYIFKTAGTYKVVFYAFNADINTKKEVVKELTIVVKP